MRQLTSLDAQFLALESTRAYGHVSGLAIYDPSTAPGGQLRREDLCRLVGERIEGLAPFRWKLAEVPFGLDHPYWIEDPDFDLDFHIRELALPPDGLAASRGTLAEHGNCSPPTVLLILDRLWRTESSPPRWVVMLAFGPGLTLYAALLERVG